MLNSALIAAKELELSNSTLPLRISNPPAFPGLFIDDGQIPTHLILRLASSTWAFYTDFLDPLGQLRYHYGLFHKLALSFPVWALPYH